MVKTWMVGGWALVGSLGALAQPASSAPVPQPSNPVAESVPTPAGSLAQPRHPSLRETLRGRREAGGDNGARRALSPEDRDRLRQDVRQQRPGHGAGARQAP